MRATHTFGSGGYRTPVPKAHPVRLSYRVRRRKNRKTDWFDLNPDSRVVYVTGDNEEQIIARAVLQLTQEQRDHLLSIEILIPRVIP